MVTLAAQTRTRLARLAQEAYPNECAGLLLGTFTTGVISDLEPLVAQATPTRFAVDPLAYLAADDTARARGLDVLGIYHSHPEDAAIPSAADVQHNHIAPGARFIYAIQSVVGGAAAELRCWQRTDHGFTEVAC